MASYHRLLEKELWNPWITRIWFNDVHHGEPAAVVCCPVSIPKRDRGRRLVRKRWRLYRACLAPEKRTWTPDGEESAKSMTDYIAFSRRPRGSGASRRGK